MAIEKESGKKKVNHIIQSVHVPQKKKDKKNMVWGAFAVHGVGNLYRVEGIMNQHK